MKTKEAGNAVVLQSGGPTAVINASLIGVAEAWQEFNDGKLFGALYGIEGLIKNELVVLYPSENFMKIRSVNYSPSSALGSSRHNLREKDGDFKEEELEQIFRVLEKRNIRYIFFIGGEDSRKNAYVLSLFSRQNQKDISVIHIPKTIDNDLTLTHHSPGFASAAQFLINAVAGLDLENRAMPGVMIDVVMGRNAGWLAAASSIARDCFSSVTQDLLIGYTEKKSCEESSGPHLVYLPEVDFKKEKFLGDISNVMQKYGRAHVVVSEGVAEHLEIKNYIRQINGVKFLAELCGADDFGHPQLSGTGMLATILCHMVKKGLQIKRVRGNTPDYLQRSYPLVSEVDSMQAYECGSYAVKRAKDGVKSAAVVLGKEDSLCYSKAAHHVNLDQAFKEGQPKIKTFPCCFIENGNQISEKFKNYLGVTNCGVRALVTIPNFRIFDFEEMAAK